MLRRIGLGGLAAIIALTFAIAPVSNTSAAIKYGGLTVPEKASAYESGLILEKCLIDLWIETNESYVKQGRVGQSPNTGDKWAVWDKPIINYHQTLKSDDNVMDCAEYDNALIKGAIKRLGIDPIHFVCEMGGKRANGTSAANCDKGTGNFAYQFPDGKITRDKLVKYLRSQVGLDLDNPGNEVRYWRSYNIVSNYCVGASITKAEWDKEGGNSRYNYKDPKTGGDLYFLASSLKNERPKYKDAQQGDVNCRTYWDRMNNYYSDYRTYLLTLSDEDRANEERSQEDNQSPPSSTEEGASSCVVEGVGWIICPVLTFTAGIVDAAYGFVSDLLRVQPLMTTGATEGVYSAWELMRNIANVAFVIAFLIIIFSQLTGMGVSNYGVKKMLPRLVISAILVNLSFWVCAIAVDISNILGGSIMEVFRSIVDDLPQKDNLTLWDGGGWLDIGGAILAGGAALGITYILGLSAFIPALIAALVAIVTVFLVLTLRQALIILLIVVAPLAFVAFLLPNTESWFTKWRKLLTTLLLMYPIIAGIFGASALASVIVMHSSDNTIVQIMGACIAVIPLAITPLVMKTAGGVLNRFAGMVNNPNRGPADRLRKAGEKYRDSRNNLRNTRALGGKGFDQAGRGAFVRWRARRGAVANGRQQEANRANTEYIAGQVESSAGFRNSVAGGTIGGKASDEAAQRALATSINAKTKLEAEELSAANVVLKNARLTQDQNRTIAAGGSVTSANGTTFNGGTSTAVRAAAIQNTVATNDVPAINDLWNDAKKWEGDSGNRLREVFADSLQGSSGRPAYASQGAIAGLRTNEHGSIKDTIESALKNNTYSPEKIAAADKDELNIVAQVLNENHAIAAQGGTPRVSDDQRQKILLNAEQALSDPRIRTSIGKNLEQVENIVNFRQPAAPLPVDNVLEIHRNNTNRP